MDPWMYTAPGAGNNQPGPESIHSGNSTPNVAQATLSREPSSPPSPDFAHHARQSGANSKIRRRNRLITSCLECRRRKLKCDKTDPCANCTRFKRNCLYLKPTMDASSQQKLADMKEKMGALEKSLEKEVVGIRRKGRKADPVTAKAGEDDADGSEDEDDFTPPEDEDVLEPTQLADLDNVDDGDDDELMDLGVQMGKLRISERIGGWIRPKFHDELTGKLDEVKKGDGGNPAQAQTGFMGMPLPGVTGRRRLQAPPSTFIGHGPDYIAPSNAFFFPGTNMNTTFLAYLPTRVAADRLIQQYWDAVHYMCRMVHRPTFEAQYKAFWSYVAADREPFPQVQALVFAAMFSAAVSMSNEQAVQWIGATRDALIDSLRSGTEMALAKANFLRTTKLDTMQAFVMYLVPQIRAEVSRAHSALVGTAIRLAECMGLHRDGTHYRMKPIEVHVRRMIWHQLCFLDLRTCDATGPRPQIKKEDYDTRLPWNVDDNDLLSPYFVPQDKPGWTDATFLRMRCELIEARRQTWFDTLQIDRKKKTITAVLMKCRKVIDAMEQYYIDKIDTKNPFQALARLNLEVGLRSLHTQVLHRYLLSTTHKMPDRLRQVLIDACLVVIENSIMFETIAAMAPWAWYRGAYNQYHTALLLLIEVYAYPMRLEAPRIWKCLDYIFEVPGNLPPKHKAEMILTDLRDRMDVYHQMRKMKVSHKMEKRASVVRVHSNSSAAPVQMVDATGQMLQGHDTSSKTVFSPPMQQVDSPGGDESQSGSVAGGDTVLPPTEEIDWDEYNQIFDPTENTGELNNLDFDMNDFTGGMSAGPLGAGDFAGQQAPANFDMNVDAANFAFMNHSLPMAAPEAAQFSDTTYNATLMPLVGQPPQPAHSATQNQIWENVRFRDNWR